MTLKEKYLKIKNINDITPEEEVQFYNELDWKDDEILKHYNYLMRDVDFEKEDEELKKDLEQGFEVPWLLRKE